MSLVAVQAVWAEDFTISIALSPETIVLSNKAGGNCGIHTDIPYSSVVTDTLLLSSDDTSTEIGVDVAKSDSQGNLIVQIRLEKVKTLVSVPSTKLTLSGYNEYGELFYGSDTIRVEE